MVEGRTSLIQASFVYIPPAGLFQVRRIGPRHASTSDYPDNGALFHGFQEDSPLLDQSETLVEERDQLNQNRTFMRPSSFRP